MLPNVHFRMPARMLLAGVLAASIALLAVLTIDGPAPAGAATGNCPGTLIESRNLNVGGKKVGELNVYYDRSTGKNCARMNHAGSTWDKPHRTRAWIGICSETRPGGDVCHYDRSTDAVDDDTYRFYAGPVTTKVSAAGKCIAASGYLWIGGKRHDVYTSPWPGHCG